MNPIENNQVVLYDAKEARWLHFRSARRVLQAQRLGDVLPLLKTVQREVENEAAFAAGFISYEAAPAFDNALQTQKGGPLPLAWFGLYEQPDVVTLPPQGSEEGEQPGRWQPSVSRTAYRSAIGTIKQHIAAGDTYQVNYSFRLRSTFAGDTWRYFLQLVRAQEAGYAAYVDTGRFAICSASPELFFHLSGRQLTSRPMKGTAARGLTLEDDARQACWLEQSEKNRAENVMIVDMIRNDVGRIAEIGSVAVPQLFSVERYPTVWQMTSTVTAETDADFPQIMQALFPCASITGAPKARTMQIIAGLEKTPRHIYTGAIGFLGPQRQAQFNVAIRTVLIDRQRQQAEYGVGGGVVWDSTDEGELDECLTKARVLSSVRPAFELLETMRWTAEEGYFLLEHHLDRLCQSADYFGYAVSREDVATALRREAGAFTARAVRVRLLVHKSGRVSVESSPLSTTPGAALRQVCLAPSPVNSSNLFLYHKTTNRRLYTEALAACPNFDDVLLWNERGEVTESCLANIVAEIDGEWITPPISSGLLGGTFRRWLLEQELVREGVLLVEDLPRCSQLWLINSVRGWQEALVPEVSPVASAVALS